MGSTCLLECRNATVAQLLNKRREDGLTKNQIETAFQELAKRIFKPKLDPKPLRGRRLLRFNRMIHLSDRNFAPETVFEKFLANEPEATPKSGQTVKWANQIPIWSGIRGPGGGRASIDIGYSPEGGKFWLYELKIKPKTDHPLYAIVELITYALGYLIIRKLAERWSDGDPVKTRIRSHDEDLLNASTILFAVLAPDQYYDTIVPKHRIKLCRSELKTLGACAEELLTSEAKKRFGPDCLRLHFSLLAMSIKRDTFPKDLKSRKLWIKEIKGNGTLRDLVLQAKPIF